MSAHVERMTLSQETRFRLKSTATQSRRDEGELLEEAVVEYLDRRDMELAAVEEGLALASTEGLISHDAMKAWLQSWGTDEELDAPVVDLSR
jgi:predicted transcriptional regulator